MDDIDRQIKEIQLQRERLALERELAQRNLTANAIGAVRNAGSGALAGLGSFVEGIGRLVAQWWKFVALLTLLAAAVYGGIERMEYLEREKHAAAQAAHEEKFMAFAAVKCVDSNREMETCTTNEVVSAQNLYACMPRRLNQDQCYINARKAFGALENINTFR